MLDGDSFFSFFTIKPENRKQAIRSSPNKGEYAEYKFFKNAGIAVFLYPDKAIKSIDEVERNIFDYCRDNFGNNLEITYGNSYRELDGYYVTNYYADNNKITLIDSPFDGVGIMFYYGPNSLFLPTEEVLSSFVDIIEKNLQPNEGVSFNL